MKLNLFSSDGQHPDFLNVDIHQPPNAVPLGESPEMWRGRFLKADLRKTWPWPDSSIDEIRAHDGPEHLASKVKFMNECWRVLKPGGLLDIFVPTTDGRGAFQDPTHVSYWTPNDLFYFVRLFAEWQRFHEAYGIEGGFNLRGYLGGNPNEAATYIENCHRQYASKVWKLEIVLECVK